MWLLPSLLSPFFDEQFHHKPSLPASYGALQCAGHSHNFWRRKGLLPPTLHPPPFSTLAIRLCATVHSESLRRPPCANDDKFILRGHVGWHEGCQ